MDKFHVVIIIERFWESLVLLAQALHIPVEYVYAPSENISVKYAKPQLSEYQNYIFEKFYQMDIILYNLSNEKFDRQIEQFGRARMDIEIEKLKKFAEKCDIDRKLCNKRYHKTWKHFPQSDSIKLTSERPKLDKQLDRLKGIPCISSLNFILILSWRNNEKK